MWRSSSAISIGQYPFVRSEVEKNKFPGVKFANAIFLVDREYRSFESFIVGTGLDDVVFEHRFDFGIDQKLANSDAWLRFGHSICNFILSLTHFSFSGMELNWGTCNSWVVIAISSSWHELLLGCDFQNSLSGRAQHLVIPDWPFVSVKVAVCY